MKLLKWALVGLVSLIGVYVLFNWWSNRNSFQRGETGTFTINVGETFQIQLTENGSTGYQNCWINSADCKSVEFVRKDYSTSLQSKLGFTGSGGQITFTFKGKEKGVDTVAIANCPTGQEGKDCSEFSIKSVRPDNTFIVRVK